MTTLIDRKSEYVAHSIAGVDYYNSFRAQLTLDVEAESKTLEQAIDIQGNLKCVGDCLLTGDWKSAYNDISSIAPTENCPQSIIDSMKADIGLYIQNNYSW